MTEATEIGVGPRRGAVPAKFAGAPRRATPHCGLAARAV